MMTMMVKTILISVATSSKFFYPVIKPPFRLADISHLKGFFLSPGMKINFQKGIWNLEQGQRMKFYILGFISREGRYFEGSPELLLVYFCKVATNIFIRFFFFFFFHSGQQLRKYVWSVHNFFLPTIMLKYVRGLPLCWVLWCILGSFSWIPWDFLGKFHLLFWTFCLFVCFGLQS